MKPVYLDYNSTTPVDPRVLDKMLPFFSDAFGNASSKSHAWGWRAAEAVEESRGQVAKLLGCSSEELIFTSGATEAINIAIRGAAEMYAVKGRHIITVATEHKAVLDTCRDLETKGAVLTVLPVGRDGMIDTDQLKSSIRTDTVLVCIMTANNETGVIQDVNAIDSICREKDVLFFTDMTQAAGKIRIDLNQSSIAMACISAHKFYGPKGAGALYIRRKNPRVKLSSFITGGGHEKNLRSGTLNVPAIVGFGEAAEIASAELWDYGIHTSKLRTILEQQLEEKCNARINGSIKDRLPNTTNIYLPGIKADRLITALPQIAFSTGSACTSALPEPSHVLLAMGLTEEEAYGCVRFSAGKATTLEDVMITAEQISSVLKH